LSVAYINKILKILSWKAKARLLKQDLVSQHPQYLPALSRSFCVIFAEVLINSSVLHKSWKSPSSCNSNRSNLISHALFHWSLISCAQVIFPRCSVFCFNIVCSVKIKFFFEESIMKRNNVSFISA